MTDQDKEKILEAILSQNSILSASDIHQAMPEYGEEELRALLLDDDFYNELAIRIKEIKVGCSD